MADPDGTPFDPTMQPGPQGQSTDASQPSTLRQMWDSWTSRPENNAAMINFGLQMMQPVPAGQSKLGHFAESAGAGLEAGGRVATQQEARQKLEEEQALKEREAERKEEELGLYGEDIRSRVATRALGAQDTIKRQRDFQKWSLSPEKGEDLVKGTSNDPVVQRIRELDPKRWGKYSKAQILNDPIAARQAQDLITGGGGGASPDQQALSWARSHPKDPRADQILDRLGLSE